MSGLIPAEVGSYTDVVTAISTTAAKALTDDSSPNLIIKNLGAVPVFVNSGDSNITVTYPTTGASQQGKTIPPGAVETYKKNRLTDTHVAAITASGSADIHISSTNGI